jgi:hyperosmotically inducible protein
MENRPALFVAVLAITAAMVFATPGTAGRRGAQSPSLEKAVVDSLLSLPYYGIFDNLAFEMDGTNVTLTGQVILPITKSEAAKRVAKISGIGKITNKIEVLPLSASDDAIRMTAYRKLFDTSDLYRYAMGAVPTIHIIVKGGHVTLEGMVSTPEDSQLANMLAKQLPGIFSVKNNLKVEKK